eukprot:gene7293-9936_t
MSEPTTVSKKQLKKEKRGSDNTSSKLVVNDETSPLSITYSIGNAPDLSRVVEVLLSYPSIKYIVDKNPHLPLLSSTEQDSTSTGSISGDVNIAKYLVRSAKSSNEELLGNNAWRASQIDQWLEVYSFASLSPAFATSLPTLLEDHLKDNTYVVGDSFTLADLAVLLALNNSKFDAKSQSGTFSNVFRWHNLTSPRLVITPIPVSYIPTVKGGANGTTTEKVATKDKDAAKVSVKENNAAVEDGGSCPPLEGAIDGQICTRFPPEPSGYLHIGHAKAVLLNQYYAQRYHGKLLVRFDDTNPSKEKEEFEENILHDLETLSVKADKVSHSSDHFQKCEELARKMISEGKAYMDNTDQEEMQAERMVHKESKNRNLDVKTNLDLFEKLLLGDKTAQSYCLRAKIDMSSLNGTMRDPVLY